jgi:hypothetical protein
MRDHVFSVSKMILDLKIGFLGHVVPRHRFVKTNPFLP